MPFLRSSTLKNFPPTALAVIAGLGSVALLAGAYIFEALGYAPCKLCYWQRWPHFAAVFVVVLIWLTSWRALFWVGAFATATTCLIGIYHSLVEVKLLPGPKSCSAGAGGLESLSADELLSFSDIPPLVRCDEIPWQFLWISMAGWNAIFSAILTLLWLTFAYSLHKKTPGIFAQSR